MVLITPDTGSMVKDCSSSFLPTNLYLTLPFSPKSSSWALTSRMLVPAAVFSWMLP